MTRLGVIQTRRGKGARGAESQELELQWGHCGLGDC